MDVYLWQAQSWTLKEIKDLWEVQLTNKKAGAEKDP